MTMKLWPVLLICAGGVVAFALVREGGAGSSFKHDERPAARKATEDGFVIPSVALQGRLGAEDVDDAVTIRRVRVIDDRDEKPVSRARVVTWDGRRYPLEGETWSETNEDGIADLPLIPNMGHLAVQCEGWFPHSEPLHATDDEQLVRVRPAGTLRVRVVDEEGDGVEQAFVRVVPNKPSELPALWPAFSYLCDSSFESPLSVRSVTDADGFVEIDPLPCGLSLRVEASIVVPESEAIATIPADARWAEVEIKAPAQGCLRGRLVWTDGTPADVMVQPLVGRYPEHNRRSSTDAAGDFVLCGLPLGLVRWRILCGGEAIRVVEIRENGDTDVGTIELPIQGQLVGRVHTRVTGGDACMPDLRLSLAHGGRQQGESRLSSAGTFDLAAPLGENWYQLSTPQGILTSGSAFVPGSLDIQLEDFGGGFELHSVKPLQWSSLVLLDMQRGPGSGVELERNSPLFVWNQDGGCRVFPLLTGRYEVFGRTKSGFERIGTVEIAVGTMANLSQSLSLPVRLAVLVHDSRGSPVPEVPIVATPRRGGEFIPFLGVRGSTGADGRVELVLGEGDWKVAALWPDEREDLTRQLTLEAGTRADLEFSTQPGSAIGGLVTWSGTPVEAGRVVAFPRAGAEIGLNVHETMTDAEGRFQLAGLAPGTWVVDASGGDAQALRTSSREVFLQEAPVMVAFDLAGDDELIRVTHRGMPVQGISRVVAHTRGRRFSRQFGRGEEPRLELEPGSYVFFVSSEDTAYFHGGHDQPTYWIAPMTTAVPGSPVDVEIAGREVRVQCTAPDGDRPLMRLVSLAGIDFTGTSAGPLVTYEDQGAERVFPDLPVGSVVQLEGWDPNAGLRTKTLTVHANSLGAVVWPSH